MHLFLRGRPPRWLRLFAFALVMLGVGAAAAWFRADSATSGTFADVWESLTPTEAIAPEPQRERPSLAPSLAELLPGLEAKAAADPANVGTQILLAQTYAELGRRAEGLTVLERLAKGRPKDGEVAFARASLLSQGDHAGELRSALEFYGRAATLAPKLTAIARLHQGEIRVRLGDRPGAVRIWQDHLARFPEEPRRDMFEAAIAQARSAAGG